MKGRAFLSGVILLASLSGMGDFGRIWAQGSLDDDFEAYHSAIEADFYSFEDSINHDFAVFIEQAWQEFIVYEGAEPPLYTGSNTAASSPASFPAPQAYKEANYLFFGRLLKFPSFPPNAYSLSDLSEKQVADGWRQLAKIDFTAFFNAYTYYSNEMRLNDWGNYLIFKQASQQGYPQLSPAESTLFLYYILSNSGYRVKIGRLGERTLILLLSFSEEVYKLPYIRIADEKYYVVTPTSERLKKLYSFTAGYPKAEKRLSLAVGKALVFPEKKGEQNLLDFYATFPLCDLSVYFTAEPSVRFCRSMDQTIKSNMRGKSQLERVTWLLNYVQNTFTHIPDVKVHGTEVYYFPEETAAYPSADCEDLSVFLSWLIHRYTSCQVLTLYYPQHVAIAVEVCDGYTGSRLMYQGKAYFICDPSYTGGKPGMVIPACSVVKPVVASYLK